MEIQTAVKVPTRYPVTKGRILSIRPAASERKLINDSVINGERPEWSPDEMMAAVADRRDRTAFIDLFEHFAPRVKAYLIRLGSNQALAEDLVQDVMLTVWNRAHLYDPAKARTSTWIFTIARNRRIDILRRERRPEIDPNDPLLVPSAETPADQALEEGRAARDLKAAVATLPEEQSTLLQMAYFEDKSHSVIAAELAIPLGTVKSRLRLALGKLRGTLKEKNDA